MLRKSYSNVVQWGFRRLYHEFAWSYDLVAAIVSEGYWARWTTAVVPLLQPGLTLELGCGTGYLQRELGLRRLPHVGLDRSQPMLRWAQAKIQVTGRPCCLVRADAGHIPFPDSSCANVVATFPAPYILAATTLAEIRRVLRPDGQFLMVDEGTFTTTDRLTTAIEFAYRVTLQTQPADPRSQLLQATGFVVSETRPVVGNSEVWVLRGIPAS